MRSVQKGEIAQIKAELRALEKGFVPSRPIVPCRYDLIIDDGTTRWRTQVKYANGVASGTPNAVLCSLNYTDRNKVDHAYTEEQVDAFIIYVPRVESLLWLTAEKASGKMKLQIKVDGRPQANSLWYEDYLW